MKSLDSLHTIHTFKASLHKAANKTKATALRGVNPSQRPSELHKDFSELAFCCCQVPILT